MNKIILCEGETDAILLSYFLEKTAGWTFCKRPPLNIAIKADAFEQSVNWYENGMDRLLICGVGGKDNMSSFFRNKVYRPIVDAGAFSRLAVVLDRDNRTVKSIEDHASSIFSPIITRMNNNQWTENHYTDAYGKEQVVDGLLVVIPTEHEGALETVMLDSISENSYDAVIVDKVAAFVKEMRTIASKYISSDRKELKARLGVTWAIQYPEKVFKLINEQIKSVAWEDSEVLKSCFGELIKI